MRRSLSEDLAGQLVYDHATTGIERARAADTSLAPTAAHSGRTAAWKTIIGLTAVVPVTARYGC